MHSEDDDRVADEPARSGDAADQASNEAESTFPDRRLIDISRDPNPGVPDHLAPDDAGDRPLIDLSRDPNPGVPDHAAPEDDAE